MFKKGLEQQSSKCSKGQAKKNKVAVSTIVQAYAIIKPSSKSEPVNDTLVYNCGFIYDYVLKPYPEIAALVQEADDTWGSDCSLSKIGILAALARRGKQA